MIDWSPDLTKVLTILRFYLLIFDNIFCPPSRLLQQSSPTRRHSPGACNGINRPMQSERSRFARTPRKSRGRSCARQPTISLYEATKKAFLADMGKPGGRLHLRAIGSRCKGRVPSMLSFLGISLQIWITRGVYSRCPCPRYHKYRNARVVTLDTRAPWPEGSAVIREN